MRFSAGTIGSLITGAGRWELRLDSKLLYIDRYGDMPAFRVEYPSITKIIVTNGLIWAKVEIQTSKQSVGLKGILNRHAALLKSSLSNQVSESLLKVINDNSKAIQILVDATDEFLMRPKYLANFDVQDWLKQFESSNAESIKTVLKALRHPYSPTSTFSSELYGRVSKLVDIFSGKSEVIKNRNLKFVDNELLLNKALFDVIESTPLTKEQRIASVVMEDRNLLVAAAGSGKTSTVVGKIGYALHKKLIKPEVILVLAFNNHAARELEERIQHRLKPLLGDAQIKVKTFHALGMEVIAETTGKKPSIANFASGGELVDARVITELITSLQSSDPAFYLQWILFVALCRKPAKNPAEFKSAQEWQSYVKETGDYQNGQSGYLTLKGEIVKSQGELAISNWLFMNGVQYEYERPYDYETADHQYRQYKPDFYFPEISCYLEHYALDAKGNPPRAFGEKYRNSMLWKQRLHATKGTDVFETTFAEFVSGEIFNKLEAELIKRGIEPKPISQAEIISQLNQPQLSAELSSLLRTFIKHAKSNELDSASMMAKAGTMSQPYRAKLFTAIASKVIKAYGAKLKAVGELDFEDLIIDSAYHAAGSEFIHPYQLILVDEFQDISRARAKLLLSFLNKSPGCKLFAVGDDWQSIYRFAGSDISIFTGFANVFGHTAINYLTKTFRSNQGIAHLAANFVQRNPSQMKKTVSAIDKTTDNVVEIRQYVRLQEMESLIEASLTELAETNFSMKHATVFILGRYRSQSPEKLPLWKKQFASNLHVEYKTIHSSKGLQADYVILIGLHSGKKAFPSEIADDPLLQIVMPMPEIFQHSEERRLFYVALTRAKHAVYLLGGAYTPSSFLIEVQAWAERRLT